jgi:hypothetical protein
MQRLQIAFELFDNYNRQDPRTITYGGADYPVEYFYALQLHRWVQALAPGAGEALLLASRCQHIGRWQIPRSDFPQTKAGYLAWRKTLARFHAEKAGELLQKAGYTTEETDAVKRINLKEGIKLNADMQVMENALCLVFLEFQYEEFLQQHDEPKVIRILQKSWSKMDGAGRDMALKLPYSEKGKEVLEHALGA